MAVGTIANPYEPAVKDPNQPPLKKPSVLPYVQPGKTLEMTSGNYFNPPNYTQQNYQKFGGQNIAGMYGGPQTPAQQPQNVNDQQLLQQARNVASGNMNSQVMPAVQQQTLQYMNSPGFNAQNYARSAKEQNSLETAQQLEQARQNLAPVANTGKGLNDLLDVSLKAKMAEGQFNRETDLAAYQQEIQDRVSKLSEGRSTADLESNVTGRNIANIANIYGATEGDRARDFTAGENALSRAQEIFMKNLDTEAQTALTELRGKIESGLKLQDQDFTATQNALTRDLNLAMQSNDINAVKANLATQLEFDKWKTEEGFKQTALQAELNRALETSLATMSIEGQKEIADLKSKADMGILLQEQDFDAAQNELSRALQEKLQQGDIAGQAKIIELQSSLEKQAQEAQREWQTTERIATQEWQKGERLEREDMEKAMQLLNQKHELALQSNDIRQANYMQHQQKMLQLQMQTNEMEYGEKMAFLNYNLQEAKANGDAQRQRDIIAFQSTQELQRMATAFGYDSTMAQFNANVQVALNNGEYLHAAEMQKAKLAFEAEENMKQRALTETLSGYDALYQQVADGLIEPEAAVEYLRKNFGDQMDAVTTSIVNQTEQSRKAIQEQFDLLKYEWDQTHPGQENSEEEFNKWFNEFAYTIDKESTTPEEKVEKLGQGRNLMPRGTGAVKVYPAGETGIQNTEDLSQTTLPKIQTPNTGTFGRTRGGR